MKIDQDLLEGLLAAIHRDNGQVTAELGLAGSYRLAIETVSNIRACCEDFYDEIEVLRTVIEGFNNED